MATHMRVEYDKDLNTLRIYRATQDELDKFAFPPNIKDLFISGDYVQSFRIPEGVITATVHRMALRELYVPDSCEMLYCDYNYLKELCLPAGIISVNANFNYLERVTFRSTPTQVMKLEFFENRIERLDFDPPSSLMCLDLRKNYFDEGAQSRTWQAFLTTFELDPEFGYIRD